MRQSDLSIPKLPFRYQERVSSVCGDLLTTKRPKTPSKNGFVGGNFLKTIVLKMLLGLPCEKMKPWEIENGEVKRG